jgi:rhodanese-related sulfurtransferase
VLNLMCRLSWRPDSCVSNTRSAFSKYGARTLLFSKFVPGLSVLAPPLSGMVRVPLGRFVLYDTAGAAVWAIIPLLAGSYLQKAFMAFEAGVTAWRGVLPWACGGLILAVLLWRYLWRRAYRRDLDRGLAGAIDAPGLRALLDRGDDFTLIDVRDEISARARPVLLPRARWIPYDAVPERIAELSLDHPIIVYCDCPHDEASLQMAAWLRGQGAREAHALRGGLDDWTKRGWPTVALEIDPAENPQAAPA